MIVLYFDQSKQSLLDFWFLWDFCFCFSFYLITLLEHLSSSPVFSGVRIARSIVFCAMFCKSLFVLLSFGHCVVCVLRVMASDYPFGIFKLSLFFFISGGKILKYFTFYVKMFVVDPTNITTTVLREEFEDTKGVFRIRISKKKQTTQLPTEKVQKDKQSSTKHYKESKRSSNTNPTKNRGWNHCVICR